MIRAWMLTARRTPAASYITMLARTTVMAKEAELTPITRPVAVARPVTRAECALGMPPEETRRLTNSLRWRINSYTVLLTWAAPQARNAAHRMRLSSSDVPMVCSTLWAAFLAWGAAQVSKTVYELIRQ